MKAGRLQKEPVKTLYANWAAEEESGTADSIHTFDPIAHAKSVGYSDHELLLVPADAVLALGCGNPVALAEIDPGETVLDLGCGGGLDAFLAAHNVGEAGRVIGVDVTPEMVEKATGNARKGAYANVEFRLGEIEHLPLDDGSIDVVISNCVVNHCADKLAAFREVLRVLRPGGRMCIADLVPLGGFSDDVLGDEIWGTWLATASTKQDYLDAITTAGFKDVAVVAEGTSQMAEADDRLAGRIASVQVRAVK